MSRIPQPPSARRPRRHSGPRPQHPWASPDRHGSAVRL